MPNAGPNTHHLSWDDLRTALFLARAGSVRKAARELGVSHSTVLRRLASLEAAAGVELFVDRGEGYETTPAGQDVFDVVSSMEEAVLGLERRVSGRDAKLVGPVRVTLPDPFAPLLAPIFADLAKEQPGIEVTLTLASDFVDLAHRAADIAIRIAETPPPDLVGHRVALAGCGIYGSEAYLRRRSTRELASLDWVDWERGSERVFARWLRANVPDARISLRVDTGWAFRDAIEAGAGVGLVPCALGELATGWQRLRRVADLSSPLWVLTHRDLRTTARVRVVRDFVVEGLRRRRALLEGTKSRTKEWPLTDDRMEA